MCQSKKDIILFCTCQNKLSLDSDTMTGRWTLTHLSESKQPQIIGMMVSPLTKFNKDTSPTYKDNSESKITLANIIRQLNEIHSFDFEYKPSEHDCLKIEYISNSTTKLYFELIFLKGEWIEKIMMLFSPYNTAQRPLSKTFK